MDTIYLNLEQKQQVQDEKITLGQVADILCADQAVATRVRAIPVAHFSGQKKQRSTLDITTIISKIQELYSSAQIVCTGETSMIIEYVPIKVQQINNNKVLNAVKVLVVCLVLFFGAAFTIITFNNDVSAADAFSKVYEALTGESSDNFTVLEISYAIGLPLGIMIFFNHFSGHRLTTDPTPIEVAMESYEYDVNDALMTLEKGKETQANDTGSSGNNRT